MTTTTHTTAELREADPGCGCRDFSVTRRSILRGAAAVGGTMALTQLFGESLMQATFAADPGGSTLVVISLRGGIDGLGMVVPHGDAGYYAARPTTAVPKASVICADPMFGLHPGMAPLTKYWTSGELAAIQAVGLPVANRSHFSAIEEVEDAAIGSDLRSGWINRMVGLGATHAPLDAVQLGMQFPTAALTGPAQTVATTDLKGLQVPGTENGYSARRYGSLAASWAGARGPLAAGAAQAVSISKGPGAALKAMPASTTPYPTEWYAGPFAEPLKNAARLIRADVGTDVIAIDAGNWDLHTNYGTLQWGSMQSNVAGLASSLAAFLDDLGALRQKVTVVTISEFGRRVAENGSAGFDHGWGNMMLVAGAGVKGGRYHGSWPGLGAASLAEGDLKVTTDYRDVLADVVAARFPDRSLSSLFPGFVRTPTGIMA